jgi:hypothetical protein
MFKKYGHYKSRLDEKKNNNDWKTIIIEVAGLKTYALVKIFDNYAIIKPIEEYGKYLEFGIK